MWWPSGTLSIIAFNVATGSGLVGCKAYTGSHNLQKAVMRQNNNDKSYKGTTVLYHLHPFVL